MIPPIGDDPDPHADLIRKAMGAYGRGLWWCFKRLMAGMSWIYDRTVGKDDRR